ncbi:MAG TPA: methylenetetrahydrofolate--tRNA-(uracil(54)-C(5))-methyltransferase (FADH(2)-oxidizing) TrmFO [Clostridiaceae bacterium]|nr:methylenetetrahydrofolate--tRNA-(uracil(54)-C(5))-methyltransferase (FADH(2)-oxidizing) TrmFO [Clostridiaceae bacterium]HBF76321.1 methylenetetrahydrofolate--tRNA-(uracil(54)-C(5))-methyltransferase (FADH(2)-oxidizing) TrmFO [Clostridiaceae bacterium]HBG39062.1 methylenetetrahydrofolate--tRNA-(uracil(54)-C(5))-methyltransferase (FADH(2)-oxidizing) TrmFO [Clostridiaceae bacterium]HBN27641.1 methylenetetrahydrofolate--tRNA-(uracil(54)-C(5))-methyltransferase (FADH(2)-oxidizing) TrmFO [Clostridi
MEVKVIGAGLAGSEAAYQLAKRGIKVKLYEMRPVKNTPAHHTDKFAELVCSNSFKSNQLENAVGLLKEELRILKSVIMECADANSVPAGGALAVDRDNFSNCVTEKIYLEKNIEIIRHEVTDINPDEFTIIATGPLTSDLLSEKIMTFTDSEHLYFYDAAAPIVEYDSIDMGKAFKASRYGKGEADYINCPMTKEEYELFYNELINAEMAETKSFEKQNVFEACMPIEKMAERGRDTLLFGPLKPVGIIDPKTGETPYAVVQLRQDNKEGTLYNMVGFQTHLKWGEQRRVFRLIPGLNNAEFIRYGVMHRNTYINSPKLLLPTLQMKKYPKIMFAGQITGVEGYIESAAMGMLSGINMAKIVLGQEPLVFPKNTAIGSLSNYISSAETKNFQPMHINFGIMPQINQKIRDKKERNLKVSKLSIGSIKNFVEINKILFD